MSLNQNMIDITKKYTPRQNLSHVIAAPVKSTSARFLRNTAVKIIPPLGENAAYHL